MGSLDGKHFIVHFFETQDGGTGESGGDTFVYYRDGASGNTLTDKEKTDATTLIDNRGWGGNPYTGEED